jgi:hypothetical protein
MSSLCAEPPHDHKGHSEEKCLRCGWVMGHRPLNCMNDDTPHVFPSQQAEIERLRALADQLASELKDATEYADWLVFDHLKQANEVLAAWEEARREQ